MKKRDYIYLAAAFCAIAFVVYRWWHPGFVIAGGDSFFGFTPFEEVRKGTLAWSRFNLYLGGPSSSGTWTTWRLITGLLITWLDVSAAQIVILFVLAYSTFAGMYLYLRLLGFDPTLSAICAIGYLFNPWTELFFGLNYPLNVTVMAIPFYASLAIGGIYFQPKRRMLLLASAVLSFTFLGTIGANPALIVVFVLSVMLLIAIGVAAFPAGSESFAWLRRFALVNVFASAWWLFLVGYFFLGAKIVAASTTAFIFVVQRASLLNVLRLNAVWGWMHPEYFPYAADYDANFWTYASSFLWAAAAMSSPLLVAPKRKPIACIAICVFIVFVFLSKGLHPPVEWLNAIFYAIPGSGLFREPTTKFQIVVVLCGVVLLATVLEGIFERINAYAHPIGKWYRYGISLAILIVTVSSATPMLRAQIFPGAAPNYHENVPGLPSHYIALPAYWRDLTLYLRNASPGAVITYPVDAYYQDDYSWGYHGVDAIPSTMFDNYVLTSGFEGYVSLSLSSSLNQWLERATIHHSNMVGRVLRDIGVRYVLYRNDVLHDDSLQTYVASSDMDKTFPDAKMKHFGPLTLYDLGDAAANISIVRRWYATNEFGQPIQQLELRAIDARVPRVLISSPAGNLASDFEQNLGGRNVAVPSSVTGPSRFVAFGNAVKVSEFTRMLSLRKGMRARWALVNIPDPSKVAKSTEGYFEAVRYQSDLRPVTSTAGVGKVQILESQTQGSVMRLEVFNPGRFPALKGLVIGAVPSSNEYILHSNGENAKKDYFSQIVGQSGGIETLLLRSVLLRPGLNNFTLATFPGVKQRVAAVVADPVVRAGVGYVESPVVNVQNCKRSFYCFAGRPLGELAFRQSIDTLPFIELESRKPTELLRVIARFDFEKNHRIIPCFASLSVYGVSPAQVFQACVGNPLSDISIDSVLLRDVVLYDPYHLSIQQPKNVLGEISIQCLPGAIGALQCASDTGNIPVVNRRLVGEGYGVPPGDYYSTMSISEVQREASAETNVDQHKFDSFIACVIHPQGRGTLLLMLNQTFSRAWIGLQPTAPFIRPHILVDGWRNGWLVEGGEPLVLVQMASLIQVLLALFGIFTIGWVAYANR